MGRDDLPIWRSTWRELRRRKVVRAGAVYAVVAWLVLQVAEIVYEPLGLPGWALTWTVLGAVLGFPVVLVLAWVFDVSARGIVRERGVAGVAGRLFALLVVLLTVAGLGVWLTTVYRPGAVEQHAQKASAAPANAIAVLPFADMSSGGDQRHLADGIAEELLDRLAGLQGLRVAARTSSFALRGFAGDVREIGRLLDVRWVLEGSVRKGGGKVRITAQLIDAADGYHVWSETYERPDQDLFALQDQVTAAIAGELARRVGAAADGLGGGGAGEMSTRDPAALELYLQGRQAWRERTPDGLGRAEGLFQQAVARDPEFAHAWSGLADTYLLQADYGLRPPGEAIALAEPAAVRAVTLRPALGEAWASIGLLRSTAGQLGPARRSLEEAMRLDPRYEMAPMWLAGLYGREGHFDRQREILQQALELNPLEPVINGNLASLLAATGEPRAARELLERVLAVTPDDPLLVRSLANLELGAGRLAEALHLARRALALDPSAPANIVLFSTALATLEQFDAAAEVARRLPEHSHVRWTLLQTLALRRGEPSLLPELAERARALVEAGVASTPQDREVLTLAAIARLRAGAPDEAAVLLRTVVGNPERLREEASLLDPASLLPIALDAAGAGEEAERWRRDLLAAATPWLARVGDGPDFHYARALVALGGGDRAGALAALERAYQAGFRQRWQLRFDPRLAPLHGSAELVKLDRRIERDLVAARAAAATSP